MLPMIRLSVVASGFRSVEPERNKAPFHASHANIMTRAPLPEAFGCCKRGRPRGALFLPANMRIALAERDQCGLGARRLVV
jgi:hypothetical protein